MTDPKLPSAADYTKLSHVEQIRFTPDTYIGSASQLPRQAHVYNFETKKPEIKEVHVPSGVQRVFIEILSNAGDNVDRSRKANVNPGKIDILMDRHTIVIKNQGLPVPIEIHPTEGVYAPELIFGHLLTSSNYNDQRTGGGRNGYGAKLTNIFSTLFHLEVGDGFRKKKYVQTWTKYMSTKTEPVITAYTGESYVQVTYQLDFARFGYDPASGYPDEAFNLFAFEALFQAVSHHIPITFNTIDLTMMNLLDFAQSVYGDQIAESAILHYEWPPGTEVQKHRHGVQTAKNPMTMPIIEMCLLDTPDEGSIISGINGIPTFSGGFHVDSVYKVVSAGVLETLSKEKTGLTVADVRPHLTLLLFARLPNPMFSSQSKDHCHSYQIDEKSKPISTVKIHLDPKFFTHVKKWDLMDRLLAAIEAKQFKQLSKADGKKKRHITSLKKYKKANEAGGPRSLECTLYITEGDSAMGYAEEIFTINPDYNDVIGLFPLKGKPLNVMNSNFKQYSENTEIQALKEILGLREGFDYTQEENRQTLRYGQLLILADSDTDGRHICALVLNFFHCRFPSLLSIGFIQYLRTPILRATNLGLKFYTQAEFQAWSNANPEEAKKAKLKYYKGLGTSKEEEILEDWRDPKAVLTFYDEKAPEMFNLSFNEKLADSRKDWIANSIGLQNLEVEQMPVQPISMYLNYEYVQYPIENLHRSIPSEMDGFKPSQRKAIWAAFKKWESSSDSMILKRNSDTLKVAQFAAFVAEYTHYLHGEASLNELITGMGQVFVGTNNLPYFTKDGNFGSRSKGGKDAAAGRYIETRPEWWLNHVFKKSDLPLLTPAIEEGTAVEPEFLLPIVPLHLINGAHGIGSGNSTFIPCYNPLEIVDALISRVSLTPNSVELTPWYRGFDGNIALRIKNQSELDENLPEEIDNPDQPEVIKPRLSMVSTGSFTPFGKNAVKVTELPVGRWTETYENWLKEKLAKKEIKDYQTKSTKEHPCFIITGLQNPNVQTLKLVKSYGMTNMVLLDVQKSPRRYATVVEMLDRFYDIRLPFYEKRRQHQIADLTKSIDILTNKIKFIRLVLAGEIVVLGQKKATIKAKMVEKGITDPDSVYNRSSLGSLSEDEIIDLQKELNDQIQNRSEMEATTANQLWLKDLQEFRSEYLKHYPQKTVQLKIK